LAREKKSEPAHLAVGNAALRQQDGDLVQQNQQYGEENATT